MEYRGYFLFSKYSVGVCGLIGYFLYYIPMFVNQTVFQSEYFYDSTSVGIWLTQRMNVKDNVVSLGKYALYLTVRKRCIGLKKFNKLPQSFRVIFHQGIMLLISRTHIFFRSLIILLVDYQVIKFRYYLFIAFQLCVHYALPFLQLFFSSVFQ